MELLIIFALAVLLAGKSGRDHARSTRQRSGGSRMRAAEASSPGGLSPRRRSMVRARHGVGWWASEALHGFPVTSTGVHAGWLANKAAADKQRAVREEARTTHLETRAERLTGLAGHRARQQEARDQIIAASADPETGKAKSRKAVREAADNVVVPFRPRQDPPLPSETVTPEPGPYAPGDAPADDLAGHLKAPMRDPRLSMRQRQRDDSGLRNVCAACGHAGTADDALLIIDGMRVHASHTADQDSGYHGLTEDGLSGEQPPSADGDPTDPRSPAEDALYGIREEELGKPGGRRDGTDHAPISGDDVSHSAPIDSTGASLGDSPGRGDRNGSTDTTAPSTEGDNMAAATAETTYDQQLAGANEVIAGAEQALAELKRQRLAQKIEDLAGLSLDSGSLSRASDIDESLQAQEKAAQQTIDSAEAYRDGLVRDHGNVNEAHQNAPQGGAERTFYQG